MTARFGEIVVDLGYISDEQLKEAIELQGRGRAKLGQIMVQLRMITEYQVDKIIEFQGSDNGKGKRFGECALELGISDGPTLAEAVKYQTKSKGVLGDILVELGYLTQEQRDEVIRTQLRSLT